MPRVGKLMDRNRNIRRKYLPEYWQRQSGVDPTPPTEDTHTKCPGSE